jgi:hypothetical protein
VGFAEPESPCQWFELGCLGVDLAHTFLTAITHAISQEFPPPGPLARCVLRNRAAECEVNAVCFPSATRFPAEVRRL